MNPSIEDKLLKILSKYPIVEPKIDGKLVSMSGGSYSIRSATKNYVLKIYSSLSAAAKEAGIMSQLSSTLNVVPAVLVNGKGELVSVEVDLICAIYEFSHGEEIGWGAHAAKITPSLSRSLAYNLSSMHRALGSFKIDAPENLQSMSGVKALPAELTARYVSAQKELQLLNPKSFTHGLIHSDLTRENIFVDFKTQRVTGIVDFGDAHYDLLIWDAAVLITQIFITKSWGIDWQAIKSFMQEYSRLNALQPNEKKALLPLMIIRNIQLLEEAQSNQNENNSKMLQSIESSVLTKLAAIEENSQRLADLLIS